MAEQSRPQGQEEQPTRDTGGQGATGGKPKVRVPEEGSEQQSPLTGEAHGGTPLGSDARE